MPGHVYKPEVLSQHPVYGSMGLVDGVTEKYLRKILTASISVDKELNTAIIFNVIVDQKIVEKTSSLSVALEVFNTY